MTEPIGQNSVGQRLKNEWGIILFILFNPLVVIFMIITVGLLFLQAVAPEGEGIPPSINAIVTMIVALFSGLLGAIISDRLSALRNVNILKTRGTSAIRGLKLLFFNLSSLENRIKYFQRAITDTGGIPPIVRSSYSELLNLCYSLQEEAANAIEEWNDIVPNAAVFTSNIGEISKAKAELLLLQKEYDLTKKRLEREKQTAQGETSPEKKAQLKEKLEKNEEELLDAQKKYLGQQLTLAQDASLTGSYSSIVSPPSEVLTGAHEEEVYMGPSLPALGPVIVCPHCNARSFVDEDQKCMLCGEWVETE